MKKFQFNRNVTTLPTNEIALDIPSDWKVYKNQDYGFELMYPPDSKIDIERKDLNYQYIRIQNYSDNQIVGNGEKSILTKGRYFLEILVFDHKLGNKNSCDNSSMINPQIVSINGVTGYKGMIETGPHSTNIVIALCINKPNVDYYIKAYEDQPAVADLIINSFGFIN